MMPGLSAVLIGIIGMLPAMVRANALYPVSLPDKVNRSSVIAEGRVESQYSFWNEAHTMIFTANRVKVYKLFSGVAKEGYLEILTHGGTVGSFHIHASDLLDLQTGEVGIFFCSPNNLKLHEPIGGKLLVNIYASSQGFYKYNLYDYSANVPFDRFGSITKGLYPAITNLTGKAIINLEPNVSFEKKSPAPGQAAIISFTPQIVNGGAFLQPDSNILTITGSGFGTPTSPAAIIFSDPDNGGGATELPATSPLIISWSDNLVKLKVPTKAGTGKFIVKNASGTTYISATPLIVNYSLLSVDLVNGDYLPIRLSNQNGLGGYKVMFSTSTAGGGRNISTAPEKAPIQRAIATWKEVCGANIEVGSGTPLQVVGDDNTNLFVLDNTNTTVGPLPDGVLASAYSYSDGCLPNNKPAYKLGFDILIRNPGVSEGTNNFTLGPCPPLTNVEQLDFETVILHELGHALGLNHIIDDYEGNQLPFVNPPKLMNFAFPNGVKRVSPDFSAKTGADYNIKPLGVDFGNCINLDEMSVQPKIAESKDECPVNFPTSATPKNTQVNFDLVHATSNLNSDPSFEGILCSGSGTGVTNTAFYAIKTNNIAGNLSIAVSNYSTTPADQQNCTISGVQLALYRANNCPAGQNFPAPIACRNFNGNGVLSGFTNLEQNATYLVMLNGLANTKASFTLTLNGSVLPVKLVAFSGVPSGDDNILHWEFDGLTDLYDVALMRSTDGINFDTLEYWNSETYELKTNFIDKVPPSTSYYRLIFTDKQGVVSYSNIIEVKHKVIESWKVYPNPAKGNIHIYAKNISGGHYSVMVFNSSGMLVTKKDQTIGASAQNFIIPVSNLPAGNYKVVVSNWVNKPVFTTSVTILP